MKKAYVIGIITGIVAIIAIGIFLFYAKPKPTPIDTATVIGEQRLAPISAGNFSALAVMNDKGEGADLRPYDGKILLLNLWATWCAPCVEELPSLGKLQAMLGSEDFQVVTVAIEERDLKKVGKFLKEHGAGNLPVLIDNKRGMDKMMVVRALPTSLLVAKDGAIKAMLVGTARWHCGKALDAVKSFIADGSVKEYVLAPCE